MRHLKRNQSWKSFWETTILFSSVSTMSRDFAKRLHNQIQDMKGAIRVFCRFRPMVQRERDGGDTVAARRVDAFTAEVIDPKRRHNIDDKGFQFDAVFDSDTSQETVFADCRELVQSAVDG